MNEQNLSNNTTQLIELLKQRDAKGMRKYGVSLDRTDLSPEEWMQHAIEEALDFACYLQGLKRTIGQMPFSGNNTTVYQCREQEVVVYGHGGDWMTHRIDSIHGKTMYRHFNLRAAAESYALSLLSGDNTAEPVEAAEPVVNDCLTTAEPPAQSVGETEEPDWVFSFLYGKLPIWAEMYTGGPHEAQECIKALQVIEARERELAELKRQLEDANDSLAFIASELDRFPCLHGNGGEGAHRDTPLMMWPELIQCIRARAVKDKTAELTAENASLRQQVEELTKEAELLSAVKEWENAIEGGPEKVAKFCGEIIEGRKGWEQAARLRDEADKLNHENARLKAELAKYESKDGGYFPPNSLCMNNTPNG